MPNINKSLPVRKAKDRLTGPYAYPGGPWPLCGDCGGAHPPICPDCGALVFHETLHDLCGREIWPPGTGPALPSAAGIIAPDDLPF